MAGANKSGEVEKYLFHQGNYSMAYEYMGSHKYGRDKTVFRVWAPGAKSISVVGDFNGWNRNETPMKSISTASRPSKGRFC